MAGTAVMAVGYVGWKGSADAGSDPTAQVPDIRHPRSN